MDRGIEIFPWPDVVGMRNRLILAYADVDPDILWETVVEDLPSLIALLKDILETKERFETDSMYQ